MTAARHDAAALATCAEVGRVSASPGVGGMSWSVLLLALVLTAGGVAVDVLRSGLLGAGVLTAYSAGCVLGTLLMRRRDLSLSPLLRPVPVAGAGLLGATEGLVSPRSPWARELDEFIDAVAIDARQLRRRGATA